jgi:hypothetical protein
MLFDPDIMATLPRALDFIDPLVEKSKVFNLILFQYIVKKILI